MSARIVFPPGDFCWADHMAHDLQTAARWYDDMFGWQHQMMPSGGSPYARFMKDGAAAGGLGQINDEMKQAGVPPMWNCYISTDDCAATEARVRELGGTVTVPTMEVPGNGKLAFFLCPDGASFAAWESTNNEGTGVLIKEHGGLSWVELMTRDMDTAQRFYGGLFGWDFTPMPRNGVDYQIIKNRGEDVGGIMPMQGLPQFDGVSPHWLVYFDVQDCDDFATRAGGSGGKVMVPPTDIPVGKFSVLADPQGGAFAVMKPNDVPAC